MGRALWKLMQPSLNRWPGGADEHCLLELSASACMHTSTLPSCQVDAQQQPQRHQSHKRDCVNITYDATTMNTAEARLRHEGAATQAVALKQRLEEREEQLDFLRRTVHELEEARHALQVRCWCWHAARCCCCCGRPGNRGLQHREVSAHGGLHAWASHTHAGARVAKCRAWIGDEGDNSLLSSQSSPLR